MASSGEAASSSAAEALGALTGATDKDSLAVVLGIAFRHRHDISKVRDCHGRLALLLHIVCRPMWRGQPRC
jgi:hypothetical protein